MPLPRGKRPDFILVEDWPQLALRPDKEQQIVIAEAKYRNSTNLERRDVVQLIEYRKNVEKILKQNVSDTLMIVSKKKISDTIWDLMEDNYIVLTRLRSMQLLAASNTRFQRGGFFLIPGPRVYHSIINNEIRFPVPLKILQFCNERS